jgi:cell division protease FtsH
MNRTIKTIVFWVFISASAFLLWQVVRSSQQDQRTQEISYSQFISKAEAGEISRVDIAGSRIRGQYRDGRGAFRLIGPSNPAVFLDTLRSRGVEIWFKDVPGDSLPVQLLGTWGAFDPLRCFVVFHDSPDATKRNSLPAERSPGSYWRY